MIHEHIFVATYPINSRSFDYFRNSYENLSPSPKRISKNLLCKDKKKKDPLEKGFMNEISLGTLTIIQG